MASKFGGLLGGGSGTGGPNTAESRSVVVRTGLSTPPVPAKTGGLRLPRVSAAPAFAIALDATGSMASSIAEARNYIGEILARVRAQLQRPIRVQFLCYRDYDVVEAGNQWAHKAPLETSPMTEDAEALSAWLAKVEARGGGSNSGEAIEAALEAAYQLTTNRGSRIAAVLLAGDEPSNHRADLDAAGRHQAATARDWARRLAEQKVPVHTFVIRDRSDTIADFSEIARLSGGKTGRLDGSSSMLNMAALAMVAAVGGASAVRKYATQHRLSGPEEAFATLLLTGPMP
jgi:von Willebrand factor type A domain